MPHRLRRPVTGLFATLALVLGLAPMSTGAALAAGPTERAGAATPPMAFTHPGQMYLDDQAHARERLTFTPGAAVSVPFAPRSGDSWPVGGQEPRALSLEGVVAPPGGSSSTTSATPGGLALAASSADLQREVFGFLGYWGLTDPIDYSGVTTLAYFGLNATKSGGFVDDSGLSGWKSSALTRVIDTAHANGVRVVLVAKCFAWSATGNSTCTSLLSSSAARQALATNLASTVVARGADGVNFDFEPIPTGQSPNFVDLVRRTRAALDARALGYEVTVDSLGWIGPQSYQRSDGYDVAALTAPGAADAMVIMGYDYKGAYSGLAGSIDPLGGPTYDLNDTLAAYLSYTSPSHVILALPWYGRAWSTTTTSAGSDTVAGTATVAEPCSVAADYAYIVEQLAPDAQDSWYPTEASPYLLYPQPPTSCHPATTDWRQLYFDDVQSLAQRYDLINARGLRGTGMWDLSKVVGANGLRDELYQLIRTKFTDPPSAYSGPPATFTPLGPTRILDTRVGTGLSGPLHAGSHRTLTVRGLPPGAVAVTVNVTVTGQTAAGYISVGPDPTNAATTSTLNFPTHDVRANGATVRLGTGATLDLLYSAPAGATTALIIDLTGVYTTGSGATFTPLGPTRILDTRVGTGGIAGALQAGVPQTVHLAGTYGVPADAAAVTLNATIVGQTAAGYLSITPAPTSAPKTSILNFPLGDIRANGITLPLSTVGSLSIVYMAAPGARANVVLDLSGYFR